MCVNHVEMSIKNQTRTRDFKIRNKVHLPTMDKFNKDLLFTLTYYTKIFLFFIGDIHTSCLNSRAYRILSRTTQPAHCVMALAILFIYYLTFPNSAAKSGVNSSSNLISITYLGAFAAHFGAQIWMTFISGLALYFSLPRHNFGAVQIVLFPKYFLFNAILSFATLVTFIQLKNNFHEDVETLVQAVSISSCFLIELMLRLYLAPPLIELITMKNEIEKEANVGMEIGKLEPGALLDDANYLQLHLRFRKLHMSIAIGNILTMMCTVIQLYYLSSRLSIL